MVKLISITYHYIWMHLNIQCYFIDYNLQRSIRTTLKTLHLLTLELLIDQVRPNLTSHLQDLWAKVVYCQRQYTWMQILIMIQPPGSHRPLHGFTSWQARCLIREVVQLLAILQTVTSAPCSAHCWSVYT